MNSSRSSRESARNGAVLGSISARNSAEKVDFADPCSPDRAKTGYGPQSRKAASNHETASTKSASVLTLRNERNVSTEPPDAGPGKAFIPAARRKRTGGLSITRQPVASISTARQDSSQRSR